MSTFSDAWAACMRNQGFPVIDAETVEDALDFVEKIHTAVENSSEGAEVTIGALIAAGAFAGLDEATLAVLGQVAAVAATAYLLACISCMGTVAADELRKLFALGDVPDFVVAQLESDGVDITQATA